MSQYIIAYIGGQQPSSPEEGKAQMEKWKTWISGLGAAVVNPGTPLKDIRVMAPDGSVREGSGNDMHGFTVVEAASIDDALDMARECPYLEIGGSLEVAEMMNMPG